ncbi:hypothetical protein LT85_0247 [Collimonas arenae]|uniref:Uncharacterized protein n=1 Tax=Collimonas arenae TaxID=279058 RepID=A0A0A1F970_9BURK|nr:hypothetical protein [Collimonas arenae]AIY39407.1 hypothetical protein LT85_0247 [Collimonas arenae]
MNEKKFAIGLGLAGCAFIALLVYVTMPEQVSQSPIELLPGSGAAAPETPVPAVHAKPGNAVARTVADCSIQRLDAWRLVSVEMGGYRQAGIAVLNNDKRGSLTVIEGQSFDSDLLPEKITSNSVTLRCGQMAQIKMLGESRVSVEVPAVQEMRTALPDPDKH